MRVRKRTLVALAACVWAAVGLMLGVRGIGLLRRGVEEQDASVLGVVLSVVLGLAIGALKGRYVLSRTARRNKARIEALAEPRVWNVFTGRFLVLIGLMILLGLGLRSLGAAGWLGGFVGVGGIYVGIGAALVAAAPGYFAKRPEPRVIACEALTRARDAGPPPPVGVLLVNLGTPASPEPGDVRRYLRQFLSDPLVVEVPRLLWAFVLNVNILPRRAGSSAALYRSVWTDEGSPLLVNSARQARRLQEELGAEYRVVLAMRYGEPSMRAGIDELIAAGCEEVRVLTAFPQASRTTTGTVQAELFRLSAARRAAPAFAFLPPCYADPGYVAALAATVREAVGDRAFDQYVFSFHGLPERYVELGDPYLDHCARTAQLLADELGLGADEWTLVFQSRFGDEPWLQPYADELVPELAARAPRIVVVTPGFSADCLETIEEIGVELERLFLEAGGREYLRVPALNEHPAWILAMADQVRSAHAPASAAAQKTPAASPVSPSSDLG